MSRLSALLLFVAVPAVFGQLRFNAQEVEETERRHEPPKLEFDANGSPICPIEDGIYEDPDFCDAYWKCVSGKPTEIFCEDGLVFDPRKAQHSDPCDTPHVVPCGTRQQLQEPTYPSEFCPRKYGVFEHPDPSICNIYYQCVNGKHTEVHCTVGLHFNGTQGNCNWPDIAARTGCAEKAKVSADGVFTCPPGDHFDNTGMKIPHPSFPHLDDCSKFYVCLSGVTPQEASCDKGMVFDERSMLCALPETVPECVGWYANDPDFAHYYDDASVAASDPGRTDVVG